MLGTYIAQVLVTDLVTSLLSVAGALLILPFLFVMSWQLAGFFSLCSPCDRDDDIFCFNT